MGIPRNRRQPVTEEIAGRWYTLEPLPPRANLEAFALLVSIVGEPLAAVVTNPEQTYEALGITSLAQLGEVDMLRAGLWLLERALPKLDTLQPTKITRLAEHLLVGFLTVDKGDDAIKVEDPAMLDEVLVDGYELIRVLRVAVVLNFRPTSAGRATAGGSASPA